MKKIAVLTGALAVSLLTGCYNKPTTSLKKPGEGPERFTGGPAVGPGTIAGGSTAGPQPAAKEHGGHVEPQPGGATPAHGGDGHMQAPTAVHGAEGTTPKTGSAQTGNETSGARGPAAPGGKH